MPRGVKKENLPSKVCAVCNRPFTWRKKWERCWDEVQTCSDRCKSERKKSGKSEGGAGNSGKASTSQSSPQKSANLTSTISSLPATIERLWPKDRNGENFNSGIFKACRPVAIVLPVEGGVRSLTARRFSSPIFPFSCSVKVF